MTDRPTQEEERMAELQRVWDTEHGPETPPEKRRLMGILAIVAFIGLIVWAVLSAPGP